MMNRKLFFVFAVLILGFVVASALAEAGTCPITSDTNIVFYGQTGTGGVGTLSRSWTIKFLDWWKSQDSLVNYTILDATDVKTDCNLTNYPNLEVYMQPGGDAYKQQKALNSLGRTNILNFIDSGKAFVGTCAGFYYAASDYYWQGSFYDWPYLLGRYSTVEGSITDIADYDQSPGYALTPMSNGLQMIYYGGPTRGWRDTPNTYSGTKLMHFTAIPNELLSAVQDNNMLLLTVHPEAYENDGITGLTTEQRIENYKWLANAINNVAGTNFSVPAYLACHDGVDNDADNLTDYPNDPGCSSVYDNDEYNGVMQCSDSLDNDADNLTDYPNDPGCSSASDNDETDVSGPAELLFDGFESGIGGWTLTTASGANPWAASTVNPKTGTYHAQAQPMSTSEPASSMEKSVSTEGYQNIKVKYDRRLIGLDIADEFKAKWFDGAAWNILEQTGSNSANDAAYVSKEFNLPSSADNNANFKIKFECTAGATSEYCRVDDVNITSN